jgi:F-type H+-transporting ATPase subunit b
VKRWVVIALMALVTAWSVWSWAQASGHGRPERAGPAATEPATGTAESEGPVGDKPEPMNLTDFGTSTPPFVAMLINFGILAAGYYLLGKKPIAQGLQQRRDRIAKQIEEAANMRREAEARAEVYKDKLAKLEDELKTTREAMVHAGTAERDRLVRDAEAKADRMRKDAEFLIEQELKQIKVELQRETVEAAIAAAEELLKKRITPADQERLAEDYLADLGAKDRGSIAPAPRPEEGA